MEKPADFNVTETVDVDIEISSDKVNNRTKITHHPAIEKLIKMYHDLLKEHEGPFDLKFTPILPIPLEIYEEEKETYSVTTEYTSRTRYWNPPAFQVDFMQKFEDEWKCLLTTSGSLEMFAELTYPAPTEGMAVVVDNNPNYCWLQLTTRGLKYFNEDIYAYDVKQFDKWFKTLNEEDSCKDIGITLDWKKHVFRRVNRILADDTTDLMQGELEALTKITDLASMPWNYMMECMLNCTRSDDELAKTCKLFFGTESDQVRVYTLLCIYFKKQLTQLRFTTDTDGLHQVARTYYIDKIMNAD